MTGPTRVFEGPGGVWAKYTGEFDVRPVLGRVDRFWVEKAGLKLFPVAGTLQAPVAATLELRRQIENPDLIEAVEIITNAHQIERLGGPEHWEVRTREAADHSLPFSVAAALRDGSLSPPSFDAESLQRSDIRSLISRMSITESKEMTVRFNEAKENVSELVVRLSDGRLLRKRTNVDPSGHPNNPASKEMINAKVSALIEPRLGTEKLERLASRVQTLEDWPSASELFVLNQVETKS
jgi:2-methylcitrate dehydratase